MANTTFPDLQWALTRNDLGREKSITETEVANTDYAVLMDDNNQIKLALITDLIGDGDITVGIDGTGYDVKFFGDTIGSYMLWDQSEDQLVFVGSSFKLGTLSSTTPGSGAILTDTLTRALEVNADDNNAALLTATLTRAIMGRLMIYANSSSENWGIHGLSKMSTVAKTGNVSAGVVGAFETTGACSTVTGAGNTFCAGVMGRVGTGGSFTIGAGTKVACFLAFGNNANSNAFTNAGYVGMFITNSDVGTQEDFDAGIEIDDDVTATGIEIGNVTTGISLSGTATNAIVISGACSAYGLSITGTCTTAGVFLDGTNKLMFDDSGMYIRASEDGHLEIISDDTITLAAQGHGGIVFGGETDWGTGATGYNIDGTGWDWATQTVAHVDSGALATACAASYNALTVTPASHSTASSFFGTWTELYLQGTQNMDGSANCAAVWGQIEAGASVTTTTRADCFTAAGYFNMITSTSFNNVSQHVVNGVRVQSEIASGSITNDGRLAAFECLTKSGSYQDWDYGLYIVGATNGILIAGATTDGISITGASSTAQINLAHTMAAYGDQCILVVSSSAATDGSSQAPIKSSHTMSGAGATGGRAEFNCTFQPGSSAAAGGWTNALKGNFTFGSNSTGGTGLHTAITAEMSVPNATVSGGEFAALDMQIGIPSSHIPQAKGLSFFTMNTYTTSSVMDDSGTLFALYGVTGADNKMFDDSVALNNPQIEGMLRIRILNNYWYIPLCDDPDGAA